MNAGTPTVPPDMDCKTALDLLRSQDAPCALVEPVEGGPGLVSAARLQETLEASTGEEPLPLVRSAMWIPADFVGPDDPLERSRQILRRLDRQFLLVKEGDAVVGTISREEIVKALDLLREHRVLNGLDSEDIVALLGITSMREVPAGTNIVNEGEWSPEIFILDRGELTVHTRQAGRIARVRAGEMIGEVEIFGGANVASVRAREDSRVLAIPREDFLTLLSQRPEMGTIVFSNIARLVAERLRKANRFLFLRGIARQRILVLRILAAIGLGVVVFTLGFAGASESPNFCNSCHYMRPYYDSWSVSPHSKISCTECHYSYGMNGVIRGKVTGLAMVTRYATRTYDPKPEAEVSDGSCTRAKCHPDSPSLFVLSSNPQIRFEHRTHQVPLETGWSLRCTSCHNHGRENTHFSVNLATCYLCHLTELDTEPSPRGCSGCHTFDAKTTEMRQINHAALPEQMACVYCHESVVSGEGEVSEDRCYSCHLEPTQLSSVRLHDVHVRERDVDCFECHGSVRHEAGRGLSLAQNCENCHPQQHAAQEQVYLGFGGRDVMNTPGVMSFFHVECTGCHRQGRDSTGPVVPGDEDHRLLDATEKSCLTCHTLEVEDSLRMWRTTIDQKLGETRSLLGQVESLLERGGDESARENARSLYESAVHNFQLVSEDKSRGVHNFRFSRDLLDSAQLKLQEALSLLRGSR